MDILGILLRDSHPVSSDPALVLGRAVLPRGCQEGGRGQVLPGLPLTPQGVGVPDAHRVSCSPFWGGGWSLSPSLGLCWHGWGWSEYILGHLPGAEQLLSKFPVL